MNFKNHRNVCVMGHAVDVQLRSYVISEYTLFTPSTINRSF